MPTPFKVRRFLRGRGQAFVVWFLRRVCGGAFHCYPYGATGRYVTLLTDAEYDRLQTLRAYLPTGGHYL